MRKGICGVIWILGLVSSLDQFMVWSIGVVVHGGEFDSSFERLKEW